MNLTDPDSKLVHGMRGWVQGYNAQAACNERHLMLAAEVSIEASVNDIAQPCGFVWILPPDPGQASHTRASSAATTSVCSSRSVAYANAVSTISASVSAVMSSIAIASRRCGEIVS